MKQSIRFNLTATHLFIGLFTASVIYFLTLLTSEQRIRKMAVDYKLKEVAAEVSHWYAAEKSWKGFEAYFNSLHPGSPEPEKNEDQTGQTATGKALQPDSVHGVTDINGEVLIPYLHYKKGDMISRAYLTTAKPVLVSGEIVAWVLLDSSKATDLEAETTIFFKNISETLLFSVMIAVIGSLLLGVFFSQLFVRLLKPLIKPSAAIAQIDLTRKVPITSDDLPVADKQITADIAHDLETPIQVISEYLEMAQERELNNNRVNVITDELEHIKRQLKDLSQLAKTNALSDESIRSL